MNKSQLILSTLESSSSKFKTVGDLIEDLDLTVSAKDRSKFDRIINSYLKNADSDEYIKDSVNKLPKDKQNRLKEELLDLTYDYDLGESKKNTSEAFKYVGDKFRIDELVAKIGKVFDTKFITKVEHDAKANRYLVTFDKDFGPTSTKLRNLEFFSLSWTSSGLVIEILE